MKNLKIVIILILTSVLLTGCGKSENVRNLEKTLKSLETITEESKDTIESAKIMFDNLTGEEKEQVKNINILEEAEKKYEDLINTKLAKEIDESILAIGEVTLEKSEEIEALRDKYEKSDNKVKIKVTNLDVLESAEIGLIEQSINQLGNMTLEKEKQMREIMSKCNENNIAKISNYNILVEAEKELRNLKEEALNKELQKFNAKVDKVAGITWYEPKCNPRYVNTRCYVLPYLGKQDTFTYMRLKLVYTGDDWIFFERITFLIDGERHYMNFNYGDVKRDHSYGDVWEVADVFVTTVEEEIIEKIANSKETIVRFQGDEYYYDYTIPNNDKIGMKQILDAYNIIYGNL